MEPREEEGNISRMEEGIGVIKVLILDARGAQTIISSVARGFPGGCALCQFRFELISEKGEAEGREEASKRATLGKAFLLIKGLGYSLVVKVEAFVGRSVEGIKEGQEYLELRSSLEEVFDGSPGAVVEHVGKV